MIRSKTTVYTHHSRDNGVGVCATLSIVRSKTTIFMPHSRDNWEGVCATLSQWSGLKLRSTRPTEEIIGWECGREDGTLKNVTAATYRMITQSKTNTAKYVRMGINFK